MKMREISQKAHDLDINPIKGMKRVTLIRAIQIKEGNYPCYGTARAGTCDQLLCCWRDDCTDDSQAIEEEVV